MVVVMIFTSAVVSGGSGNGVEKCVLEVFARPMGHAQSIVCRCRHSQCAWMRDIFVLPVLLAFDYIYCESAVIFVSRILHL